MGTVSPAKKREPTDADALTGAQFAKIRAAFDVSQASLAAELGVNLRTVIRLEASAGRAKTIPLSYAKHMRCLARERRIDLKKLLK